MIKKFANSIKKVKIVNWSIELDFSTRVDDGLLL